MTGLIKQWGQGGATPTGDTKTINYSVSFRNENYSLVVGNVNTRTQATYPNWFCINTYTAASFTYRNEEGTNLFWEATGY